MPRKGNINGSRVLTSRKAERYDTKIGERAEDPGMVARPIAKQARSRRITLKIRWRERWSILDSMSYCVLDRWLRG